MDQVTYDAFKEKLDNAILQNKQLKRANLNMKAEIRELRRQNKKLRDKVDDPKKPKYKNKSFKKGR